MGKGQKRNKAMVKKADKALEKLKYEVAVELGIDQAKIKAGYWGHLSARDCGAVGGHMVRKMIEAAEKGLANEAEKQ
ncbi:MAG: small, acid-soluble spore protein, alpha/beta type [Bacillota bacterium]